MRVGSDYFGSSLNIGILETSRFNLEQCSSDFLDGLIALGVKVLSQYEDLETNRLRMLFECPTVRKLERFDPIPFYYLVIHKSPPPIFKLFELEEQEWHQK